MQIEKQRQRRAEGDRDKETQKETDRERDRQLDAVKIFLWLKKDKPAILNKTLTTINTGRSVLPEHIGKALLKFSQKAVLSCDTLG